MGCWLWDGAAVPLPVGPVGDTSVVVADSVVWDCDTAETDSVLEPLAEEADGELAAELGD